MTAGAQPSVRNLTDLTGRVAVVIGGTSGLGRAIALGVAQAGADVVASGRREALVGETTAAIERLGRRTLAHVVDVSARASIQALCEKVCDRLGGVDILVNAAGRTQRRPTADVARDEWDAIIETNLTGTLYACQAFLAPLARHRRGRIVNIASLSSFVAFHEVAAYGAAKAAVLSLTRSLGTEWAPNGVNVNAVVPGVFRTDLNAALLDGTERGRELLMRTPMGRFGRTDEVVGAAVFLASDAASFITGQSIVVDGGFLASGVNS